MTPALLSARGLSVSLGGRQVLHATDLALPPGELVALVGPNGAGKTTLLRAIAGLVPSAGTVFLGERRLTSLAPRERARLLAYLPQGGTIGWPLAVEHVVALGRMPHGASIDRLATRDRAAVARALARADLLAFQGRLATALSGGERSRVLLARALAVEADILLADEPVASLDPRHQLSVMATLRDEARAGRAVVVVLHDLGLAARHADRLIVLDKGHVVADGPPADILTPERAAETFGIEILAGARADGRWLVPWKLAPSAGN